MPDPQVLPAISLQYPYTTAAGQKIDTLTLRRAKVRDMRAMESLGSTDAERELGLLARLANVVPEDLDDMDATDLRVVMGRFRELLGVEAG